MLSWTRLEQQAMLAGAPLPQARSWTPTNVPNRTGKEPGLATKRLVDLTLALLLIALLAPVGLLVAIAIKMSSRGPVIYRHERVGRYGQAFTCLKFRTMVQDAEARLQLVLQTNADDAQEWSDARKLRRDPRITPLGQVLRATSLDELPQLLNVLRGDMSLVGPRPITDRELARYGRDAVWYLSFRPGLTGPWQVSGRSLVPFRTRVRLDTNYVRNWSLTKDAYLLAKTPWAVLKGRGAY